jgi:integrase
LSPECPEFFLVGRDELSEYQPLSTKRDLTDRFLKSIKPAPTGKRSIIPDAQIPGFGIRVTEHSRTDDIGSFVLVARFPGSSNPAPRKIGDYPAMSLAKARELAREWREDIRQGIDPKVKQAEQRRQEERRRADSFSAVFAVFSDDHLSTLRSGGDVKSAIERRVIPIWGDRPVSEIRRADINELIRGLRKTTPIGANRVLAYLKKFFGWLVDQDIIENSPAAAVKRPSKEVRRDRVLADAEIRAIWLACGELGAFGRAFKFLLVSGQRRSEVGQMAWREVDGPRKTWTLSRDRTKADRAHEIPLSDMAMSIVEECPRIGPFVFSTGRSAPGKTGATSESRPISGWSKAKAALDKMALRKLQALAEEHGEAPPTEFPEWHLHDLRRTAATNLARLGVDRVVISKILNHSEGGVTSIYDRHARDDEKRLALERWGQRLQAIVAANEESGSVVTFAAATAP